MKKMLLVCIAVSLLTTVLAQEDKAVSYKELQKHLPRTIVGFTSSGDPDGQSLSMNDMSYSMASREYNNGEIDMTITIMDYKGAGSLYNAAAMAWTINIEYEDNEKKVSGFKDGDFHGVIEIGKEYEEVTITSGYKERYFIQIQIHGSNDEATVKKALDELQLGDLP